MARRPRRGTRDNRLLTVGVVFVLAWGGIGFRLFEVQGVQAGSFAERGQEQRVRNEDLPADRGTIFDRDGVELAVSIRAVTMIANPSVIKRPKETARLIAPLVGVDRDDLAERLSNNESQFAYVARRLERSQVEEVYALIEELGIEGFWFVEEPKRVYPAGPLAAQVVGFVQDDDGVGIEGLEFQYDAALAGEPGRQIVERDPFGKPIPQGEFTIDPPVPGADLVLTLDGAVQYATQQFLEKALRETKAVGGTVVVLSVKTGEILAMANAPTFDPNERSAYDPIHYRNRAVADVYEPGSTLKVVTISAAMNEGIVERNTLFDVPGELEIHDKVYTDEARKKAERMTVADIVARSSNIGTILIEQELGNDLLSAYLQAFGLGKKASGEFPGEASGSLQPVSEWCDTTCGPSTAIGYRVGVTPLQMASVFGAIANDGLWIEPHIVRETLHSSGERDVYDPVTRPVLSESTAGVMRRLLQGVVEEGTGWRAAIDGYTVGGKTGTTEKFVPGKGYSKKDRIASFIGMAPVDDPELVVAVMLDSPHGELAKDVDLKFGGVSAAPLFAEVMEAALHRLGVAPDAE
ncbi:MAG TPA: penicillin-binding protein 2 [Acidimicrobiia bacterium]